MAAAAAKQESFGCVVANRFHLPLDDESDPFDILLKAERQCQQQLQHKRRDEGAAAAMAGAGGRGGQSPAAALATDLARGGSPRRSARASRPPALSSQTAPAAARSRSARNEFPEEGSSKDGMTAGARR